MSSHPEDTVFDLTLADVLDRSRMRRLDCKPGDPIHETLIALLTALAQTPRPKPNWLCSSTKRSA